MAFQPMIAATGSFVAPIGDARISAVDVRDIAAVAAIALVEEGHESHVSDVRGGEPRSLARFAADYASAFVGS